MGQPVVSSEALRCVKCGGPLSMTVKAGEIVKCDYCSFPQRISDATKNLDQLRVEVYEWMRNMLPSSFMAVQTVDPVSRSQIFENIIKPKVGSEHMTLKMEYLRALSESHLEPPYLRLGEHNKPLVTGKDAFKYGLKYRNLVDLAVIPDHAKFVGDMICTAEGLGYLDNIVDELLKPDRDYEASVKNLQALKDIMSEANRAAEAKRYDALKKVNEGLHYLLDSRDPNAAESSVTDAIQLFGELSTIMPDEYAIVMLPAIRNETIIAQGFMEMIRAAKVLRMAGQDPLEFVHKCSLYVNDVRVVRSRYNLGCSSSVFKEAAEIFSRVTRAKLGEGTLRTLGASEVMVGCWKVDLNYSFQTGALWMKQGKAVEESLVVLGVTQNVEMVTDIFGETRVAGSFGDSIKGKETTLTAGILKNALAFSNEVSVPASSKVFPPVVNKEVALILARDYLNRVSYNSGGKIRLSIPTVATLVFLPFDSRSGSVKAGPLSIGVSNEAQGYIRKSAL